MLHRAIIATLALVAAPAVADELTAPQTSTVTVSISYAINAPLASTEAEAAANADASYRRAFLLRSKGECADLLATIASDCQLTSISISSQVNNYPGQPPALYVSTSVTLQITLGNPPAP